ncbi:SRPBCC family protein [Streptomyces sp. NPDC091272]|uniref:aromatase/cyclase n=1 Tax=Streptomyces sp. NPDC091272 TaxID=3365981 RepID=UPI003811DBB6
MSGEPMPGERVLRTAYTVEVQAPAAVVYGLISDTTRWPLVMPPTVHVERLDLDGELDRFQMWVTANGEVKSWFSRRTMDPVARRISFRHETPAAPALAMGGRWSVDELGGGRCRLTLDHDFTVAAGLPDDEAWLRLATDTNSRAELDRVKAAAENADRDAELLLTFEDELTVKAPPELLHDFLYRIGDWPAVVPHVAEVELSELSPGVQRVRVESLVAEGAVRTTESTEAVRLCFPAAYRIVEKATVPSRLCAEHVTEWSLTPGTRDVTAVCRHSVLLREEAVTEVLGAGTTLAQARSHVRETLGRRSRATLALAARHAESAVRPL